MQERNLSGVAFPYVWFDTTYVKCRGGHAGSMTPVTATGTGSDGYRRLLGMDDIGIKTREGWRSFLASPFEPGAVRLTSSAIGCAPARQKKGAVLGILKTVFTERDSEPVRELNHLAIAGISGFCPKASKPLEDAKSDAPAYLTAPRPPTHQQGAGKAQP